MPQVNVHLISKLKLTSPTGLILLNANSLECSRGAHRSSQQTKWRFNCKEFVLNYWKVKFVLTY